MRYLIILTCIFFLFSFHGISQGQLEKGTLSLGTRVNTSVFDHDPYRGLGVGGQFRLQLLEHINTEWFADWITIDLGGAGTRNNAHIGWSVFFYPKKFNKIAPYAIAGHCFDFAKVTPLSTPILDRSNDVVSRWSSAIQTGLGSHFFINDRFDVSFSAQYMLHLGKHLEYELIEMNDGFYLQTHQDNHADERFEGHIFLTLSLNYKIAKLW